MSHRATHILVSVLAVLLAACGTPGSSPARARQALTPPFDYWLKVRSAIMGEEEDNFNHRVNALQALEREAVFVLEAEGTDRFHRIKSPTVTPQLTARGYDGYRALLPDRAPSSQALAILIVPGWEIIQGDNKTMDEVILDVRDALKERGFDRFVVSARLHGLPVQIYPNGLPSREQVARTKRPWKESTEEYRNQAQPKP